MKRWSLIEVLIALMFVVVGVATVCSIWFQATHHCVRSHLEDVAGHYQSTSSGNDSVWIPAHIERVCDAWEKNR